MWESALDVHKRVHMKATICVTSTKKARIESVVSAMQASKRVEKDVLCPWDESTVNKVVF